MKRSKAFQMLFAERISSIEKAESCSCQIKMFEEGRKSFQRIDFILSRHSIQRRFLTAVYFPGFLYFTGILL